MYGQKIYESNRIQVFLSLISSQIGIFIHSAGYHNLIILIINVVIFNMCLFILIIYSLFLIIVIIIIY